MQSRHGLKLLLSPSILSFTALPHPTTNPQLPWVWGDFAAPRQGMGLSWGRWWSGFHSSCSCWAMRVEGERMKRCEVGTSISQWGHSPACPQPVIPASPVFPSAAGPSPGPSGEGASLAITDCASSPCLQCPACCHPIPPLIPQSCPSPQVGGSFGDLQLFTTWDHQVPETPTQAVTGVLSYSQGEPLGDGTLSH